jgi:hypothetical protein
MVMNKVLFVRYVSVCYHNRLGGICPACKADKCLIVRTMPWTQGEKLRYHKCECGQTFTSIEEEMPLPAVIELPPEPPKPEPAKEMQQGMSAAAACKVSKNRKKGKKKR